MKIKKYTTAFAILLLIALCTACAGTVDSNSSGTAALSTEKAVASASAQASAAPETSTQTPSESSQEQQTLSPEEETDYSAYTGSWLCKAEKTSMEIEVDATGNVQGSITTVVGSHVPSSLLSGTIADGVLTSNISSDDTIPGTITISFLNPQFLTAAVQLDPHEDGFTLAEGELVFERYTQE